MKTSHMLVEAISAEKALRRVCTMLDLLKDHFEITNNTQSLHCAICCMAQESVREQAQHIASLEESMLHQPRQNLSQFEERQFISAFSARYRLTPEQQRIAENVLLSFRSHPEYRLFKLPDNPRQEA